MVSVFFSFSSHKDLNSFPIAAVKDATVIMKEFTLEFYGMQLHRGLMTDYFSVLSPFPFSFLGIVLSFLNCLILIQSNSSF